MRKASAFIIILTTLVIVSCSGGFTLLDYFNARLELTPQDSYILNGVSTDFELTGGTEPYKYEVRSGPGEIDRETGSYLSDRGGTSVIRGTDYTGLYAEANVTVVESGSLAALVISPTDSTVLDNTIIDFDLTGGMAPYHYEILSGPGLIDSSTGEYQSATGGTAVIRGSDILGQNSDTSVEVIESGSLATLLISPTDSTVLDNTIIDFDLTGGMAPYHYEILSGPGLIDSSTGEYQSATGGTAVIRGSDILGQNSDTSVEVIESSVSGLQITPMSANLSIGESVSFVASGGDGNYSYSINWGDGSVEDGGTYTAAAGPWGFAIVLVQDGTTATAEATVRIEQDNPPFTVTPSSAVIITGDTVTFTASASVPAANWTLGLLSFVQFDNYDNYVDYTPSAKGTGWLEATDTEGNVVNVPIKVIDP